MSNTSTTIESTELTKVNTTTNMVKANADTEKTAAVDPQVKETYVFVATKPLGRRPVKMTCPHCYKDIVTVVDYNISARTHLSCIMFLLFGCILCAPCVYCSHDCRAKEHFCPRCENFLGSYDG